MRVLLALLLVLAAASCGSGEELAEEAGPLSTDFLCPPVLQRLEKLDLKIRKLSKVTRETDPLTGVRSVGQARAAKIERARDALLRVRTNAAALGCLPN